MTEFSKELVQSLSSNLPGTFRYIPLNDDWVIPVTRCGGRWFCSLSNWNCETYHPRNHRLDESYGGVFVVNINQIQGRQTENIVGTISEQDLELIRRLVKRHGVNFPPGTIGQKKLSSEQD